MNVMHGMLGHAAPTGLADDLPRLAEAVEADAVEDRAACRVAGGAYGMLRAAGVVDALTRASSLFAGMIVHGGSR